MFSPYIPFYFLSDMYFNISVSFYIFAINGDSPERVWDQASQHALGQQKDWKKHCFLEMMFMHHTFTKANMF